MDTISRLFDLADPAIVKLWDETNTQLSKTLEYKNLGFADDMASHLNPEFQSVSGHGIAILTPEGQPYSRQDRVQGYKKTLTPEKFTDMATITEEMLRFDLFNAVKTEVVATANSTNQRIDTEAAKIFYLGFGTTNFTGGDGKALFAYDHPATGAGVAVQRNIFQTTEGHLPLTESSLELAAQRLNRLYDNKGVQLAPCRKLKLIVSRENFENAMRITKSDLRQGTANNDLNVWKSMQRITVEVANWIPDTYKTYWFIIDEDRASNMLMAEWGWKPRFDSDNIINNGTKIYTASTMFKMGFCDFRFAFASKGDSTVISS